MTDDTAESWPTMSTDQTITAEILKRHSRMFGHVKLVEHANPILGKDGETFQVVFPAWQQELHERFEHLYGPVDGVQIFEKAMRWAIRELFDYHSAMTFE